MASPQPLSLPLSSAGWPRAPSFQALRPGTVTLALAMVGGQPEAGSGQGIGGPRGPAAPASSSSCCIQVGQVSAGAAGHRREEELDHLAKPPYSAGRDAGLHHSQVETLCSAWDPGPGAGGGWGVVPRGR